MFGRPGYGDRNLKTQLTEVPDKSVNTGNLYLETMRLLKHGEQLPHNVYEIIRFCSKKNLPVSFSRNEPAGSCLDASRKRNRIDGQTGIPLRDEMKTLAATFMDADKRRRIIAVHCRGDRCVDFKKVKRLMPDILSKKTCVSLLDEHSLMKMYGMRYGIVNPLLLDIRSGGRMLQIFDAGLLDGPPPYMMMTNAGEYTWGMEFDAARIICAVNAHIIETICK